MQDGQKAVWSIPYISVAFFPSLKQNFIAYCSSKVSSHPDCIFEIDQLWQSGFNRVYSNCCCSCSLEREIIKISQSSHKIYSNNILNFQESTTILNAHTKNFWKLMVCSSYLLWLLKLIWINSLKKNRNVNIIAYMHFFKPWIHTHITQCMSVCVFTQLLSSRENVTQSQFLNKSKAVLNVLFSL